VSRGSAYIPPEETQSTRAGGREDLGELEAREERPREHERPDDVARDCGLDSLGRDGPLGVERARVVDEHVDPLVPRRDLTGDPPHVVEVARVASRDREARAGDVVQDRGAHARGLPLVTRQDA
jgi:hypothetical protein